MQDESKKKKDQAAWKTRMDGLLAQDLDIAAAILQEHGLTLEAAKAFVRKSTASGVIRFEMNAPAMLQDPTHPASAALALILISTHISESDPQALQLGRLWARHSMGMQFPEIAKATQAWWLGKNRGNGGQEQHALRQTIKYIVEKRPYITFKELLNRLSDEAWMESRYEQPIDPEIHITEVGVDDDTLVFYDRQDKRHTPKLESVRKTYNRVKLEQKNMVSI